MTFAEASSVHDPYARSKNKIPISEDAVLLAGNANLELAQKVSDYLGRPLCNAEVKTFADGETSIYIKEKISGKDVYIIQGTSRPVNDNVMQLFLLVSAAKRAGARSVTCAIPYYGYAR